jgi:NADH-quinone oxidoreductase subunit I
MWSYLEKIFSGAWSLAVGMWITLGFCIRRPVTVSYPRTALPIPPRYRGHVKLIANRETGAPNCVVCMACQKACPSFCLKVDGHKPEGSPKKNPTLFVLDFTTCSLCGLCVESCRFDALTFSKEYNLASFRKEDYVMDLLAGLTEGRR